MPVKNMFSLYEKTETEAESATNRAETQGKRRESIVLKDKPFHRLFLNDSQHQVTLKVRVSFFPLRIFLSAETIANAIQFYFRKLCGLTEKAGRQVLSLTLLQSVAHVNDPRIFLLSLRRHFPRSWAFKGYPTVQRVRAATAGEGKKATRLCLWSQLGQPKHERVLAPTVPTRNQISRLCTWNYCPTKDLQGIWRCYYQLQLKLKGWAKHSISEFVLNVF